jgi:hypothetical protein
MTARYGPNQRDRLILRIATPLGLALFHAPLLANYAGFTVLPFDQHHFIRSAAWAWCCGT